MPPVCWRRAGAATPPVFSASAGARALRRSRPGRFPRRRPWARRAPSSDTTSPPLPPRATAESREALGSARRSFRPAA
eukprot:2474137-Pleurochrysis_carterae.AAC.2